MKLSLFEDEVLGGTVAQSCVNVGMKLSLLEIKVKSQLVIEVESI
jgi:hypothetical protein